MHVFEDWHLSASCPAPAGAFLAQGRSAFPYACSAEVPLMIGARDRAFPRLNVFGFWMTAFGALTLYSRIWFTKDPTAIGSAEIRGLHDPKPYRVHSQYGGQIISAAKTRHECYLQSA